jgi:Kae1-associated kinase Bud32
MENLIAQGAEAKIFHEGDKILKKRTPKYYRLKELDEKIRKSRTKREAKILSKAKKAGVNVPQILNTDKKGIPREKFNLKSWKNLENK